jgi:hypothetical protein
MSMRISGKQASEYPSERLERAVGKVRRTLALDVIAPLKGLAKTVDDGVFDVEHGEPVQNFKIPGQVNEILKAAQKVMSSLEDLDSAMDREAGMAARVAARFTKALEEQGAITRPTPLAQLEDPVADQQQVAVAPPGWENTVKHMKKHKEIDNPWALAWHMKNKGDTPHHASDPKIFLAAHAQMKREAAARKV